MLRLLPDTLQDRLKSDPEFRASLRPIFGSVIHPDVDVAFEAESLFDVTRKALRGEGAQELETIDAVPWRLWVQSGQVRVAQITEEGLKREGELEPLVLLSPDTETRLATLKRLKQIVGPASALHETIFPAVEQHALSNEEADALFREMPTCVKAEQAKMWATLERGHATTRDLVPRNIAYYEQFCGPLPSSGTDHEVYLTSVLRDHRRTLLQRDLAEGLRLCLMGNLRDDLSPVAWVEEVSDDALWAALVSSTPQLDPMSLLGALDIALARQHDERFKSLSAKATKALIEEKFPRREGIDAFELFPVLVRVVRNQLGQIEGFATWPPFWKNMCSWMQGVLLLRLTSGIGLELERMRSLAETNRTRRSGYTEILELQQEPLGNVGLMSPFRFRAEVLGRLALIQARHAKDGRSIPFAAECEAVLSKYGPLLGAPGPLEGHRLPINTHKRRCDGMEGTDLAQDVRKNAGVDTWIVLRGLSESFVLAPQLLSAVVETVGNIQLSDGWDKNDGSRRLENAAIIADAHRATDLADAVASRLLGRAPSAASPDEAGALFDLLVLSSSAQADSAGQQQWVTSRLAELAARVPEGECASELYDRLRDLREATPAGIQITSKALALIRAAF